MPSSDEKLLFQSVIYGLINCERHSSDKRLIENIMPINPVIVVLWYLSESGVYIYIYTDCIDSIIK